ncbi:MAG: hypothetical protein HY692_04750 [Cyanobacteria bacterium NC_groundwater_1444_Ag_S-0.65um_54_12]|nr:hypothetical protein [Cyanobacteria bacterium NC_groundwater_1444_Ag_S-0.65um_54_12]
MYPGAKRFEPKGEELGARFTISQKKRVLAAAAKAKLSPSEFIREAVLGKADSILAKDLAAAFNGFVGLVSDPTLAGREHSRQYAAELEEKHTPGMRRTRRSGPVQP